MRKHVLANLSLLFPHRLLYTYMIVYTYIQNPAGVEPVHWNSVNIDADRDSLITPVAGSNFGPLSQTHFSKSEFKNSHISRFCFVYEVLHVMSLGKFSLRRKLTSVSTHESESMNLISKASCWKRDSKKVSYPMSNTGINESTLHKVMSFGYQVKQNLKSRS